MRRRRFRQRRQSSGQLGRWLISYADYMTLMFALFVVLYALGVLDRPALAPTIKAIHQATSRLGLGERQPADRRNLVYGELLVDGNGGLQPESAEPGSLAGTKAPRPELTLIPNPKLGTPLQALSEQLIDALEPLLARDLAELEMSQDWLTLRLNAALVFASGSTTLSRSARSVLAELSSHLGAVDNYIRVRGYTDSQAVVGELYQSNWQLSAARATAVLSALEQQGIAPPRLALEGYGRNRPVASNATADGRARNRRVEIAVSKFAWEPPRPQPHAAKDDSAETQAAATDRHRPEDADHLQVIRLPHGGLRITTRVE